MVCKGRVRLTACLSVFLCEILLCVSFFLGQFDLSLSLQVSIPLFFAQTRSFCSFFCFLFFYNALRIQKRQHVGILKQCAPPWLHESSFTFYLVFCVLFRSLFLALISFWGLLLGVSPCYVVVIHMSYCKDEILKIFSFTMLFLCVSQQQCCKLLVKGKSTYFQQVSWLTLLFFIHQRIFLECTFNFCHCFEFRLLRRYHELSHFVLFPRHRTPVSHLFCAAAWSLFLHDVCCSHTEFE